MGDNTQVLIVDDDLTVQRYVARTLRDSYTTLVANNGMECLEIAQVKRPDIILLDVEMEGINGYEVCDRLKCADDTKDIPVIFLSGHSSLRERMLGYEAGAIDYMVKPFERDELLAKVNAVKEVREQQYHLQERAKTASETAMTAMKGSSELGRLMDFVDTTYQMLDIPSLAKCMLQATSSFNLNCCVMIRVNGEELFFGELGDVKPLEKELITLLANSDQRFHDFGCRTQINYTNVSLLVKNMPLDDRDTYGRYKDMLPHVVSAVDTQVKNIVTLTAMVAQTEHISVSFDMVNETLSTLSTRLQDNENKCLGVMRGMMDDLESRVPTMGLDDDQEKYLMDLVDNSIHDVLEVIDQSGKIRGAYADVMVHLRQIGTRQARIAKDISELHKKDEHQDNGADGGMDVELF